ncbi:MAG: protease inhibitor I42 family protein [Candidatus Aminicenantaceae bacterium]
MKYLALVVFNVMIIPMFFLVYSTDSEDIVINITCKDFMKLNPGSIIHKEVRFESGEMMKVILYSNPTTGFQWELKKISEPSVLKKMKQKYEASDDKKKSGAHGIEIWTFKALKKGKSLVHMQYRRSWEKDAKSKWSVVFAVDVE